MASTPFKALYMGPDGTIAIHSVQTPYTPTEDKTLIKVQYSGINPADLRHYHMGFNSYIMGYDYVGVATTTGPNSPFSPGDQLFGMTQPGHKRPPSTGCHQAYLLAEPYLTWRRPADMDPLVAVRLASAAQTAADALFNCLGFGLPAAVVEGDRKSVV